MRFLLLFLWMLFIASASFGQKYSFIPYSTVDGLLQTQVYGIVQDDDGYLWVGTIGGLSRFNGDEFISYTTKEGLLNNRIKCLHYFESTLWIGHDGGISSLKGNEIKSYALSGDDASRPTRSIMKFNDNLLVLTNGGGIFVLKNNALVPIDMGGNKEDERESRKRVRSGYVHEGYLYLATRAGVLRTTDLKTFELQKEFGDHSYSSVLGDEESLILTTYDSLLVRKKFDTGEVTFRNPQHLTSIRGCHRDADKTLWLFGKEGILQIQEDGTETVLDQDAGMPLNDVNCVFQDTEKNIWIGSGGRGMFRFAGLAFSYFDVSTGYLSNLFMTGFQKENGDLYFGTFDKSVIRKPKNGPAEFIDIGDPNLGVWASINNVDNKSWFCSDIQLVAIDKQGKVTIYKEENTEGLPGEKIVVFERIDDNSMYIGGNEGVSIYKNGQFERLGTHGKEFMGVVRDLIVVDGVLHCVSNLGLFIYENGNFRHSKDLKKTLYNIEVDNSGRPWIGSEQGLYYKKNNEWVKVDILGGEPRANTINFLNYREGKLYVGTNNGLFVFEDLSGELKSVRYGVANGLPDLETNLNSSFFDNEGNFWFGTSTGLVCFHENRKVQQLTRPKFRLKSILLNYNSFDYSAYSTATNEIGLPKDLTLPYNKNNLIFEFDGISLVDHDNLKFQFFLEGLSEDWSPLSSNPNVTFTNLPAGEYVLKVRAVDINGRTSEVYEIPLVIRQAFYKTWWFILICALVLASLIVAGFRMRINRIRRMNENEMLNYRTRLMSLEQKSLNASMNRHFIFNSLNSIQYFINTRDRLSANKYLTNFAQLIRKNLDTATSEDNRITLEEEVERIRLYMSLESMRFKDRFDYKIEANGIDLESYVIPAMIMQPFIENSIIHGILPNEEKKGMISIDLSLHEDILHIYIEDNGIGVNQSISRKAVDMGDHRSQGMEITSKRIELMQEFSDRSMELIGPKEIVGDDGSINGTYVLLKIRVENLAD